jgi:copper chaperone
METITFKVNGMSCAGCVASVTRVLQSVPGVEQVAVGLEAGNARVSFDPARTGFATLAAAVESAGYDVVS